MEVSTRELFEHNVAPVIDDLASVYDGLKIRQQFKVILPPPAIAWGTSAW